MPRTLAATIRFFTSEIFSKQFSNNQLKIFIGLDRNNTRLSCEEIICLHSTTTVRRSNSDKMNFNRKPNLKLVSSRCLKLTRRTTTKPERLENLMQKSMDSSSKTWRRKKTHRKSLELKQFLMTSIFIERHGKRSVNFQEFHCRSIENLTDVTCRWLFRLIFRQKGSF